MGEISADQFINNLNFDVPKETEQTDTDVQTQKIDPESFINNLEIVRPSPMEGNYNIPEFNTSTENKGSYISNVIQGATRELRDFGSLIKTGSAIALGSMILKPEDKLRISSDVTEQIGIALKNNPSLPIDIGKSIVTDLMASYGQVPGDLTINPKVFLPRIAEKFKDKPIETAMDLSILAGLAKKAGSKVISQADKVMAKKIIDKNGRRLKIINDDLKAALRTDKDDLLDNVDLINKMGIKQLDEPKFVMDKGRKLSEDIIALEKAEAKTANKLIEDIAKQPIDNVTLRRELGVKLRNKGLVEENGEVISELNKTLVKTELDMLKSDKPLNAKALKLRLDNIDDAINYTNPTVRDQALKEIRKEYRNILGDMSPEFDQLQKRRHDFLNKFSSKLKQIKKTGGGEKFSKNFFGTEEELSNFNRILQENPQIISADALARFEQIKAWHSWNNYFKQNERFVPSFLWVNRGVPIPFRAEIYDPIRKKVTKASLKVPKVKGKKIGARLGLEISDSEQ